MKKTPFERSKRDKEMKGKGKEGSAREEAYDAKQKKGTMPQGFANGGRKKC